MRKCKYTRCGGSLKDLTDGPGGRIKSFASINAAKRESRQLQTAIGAGGLGGGLVRVVPHIKIGR